MFFATAEDMNCDLLAIKGSGTGVDDVRCFFYTEDHYTVGRAGNLDNLDAAVSGVEAKVDNLDSDLGTVGGKVDNLDSDLVTVGAAVTSIEGKVGTLSTDVGALSTSVSGVGSKVDNLDSDLVTVGAAVTSVDGKVDEIVGTLSVISGGTGANTVTLTVSDGTNVVSGVRLTVHNSTQTDAGLVKYTDANGQAVFGLDNGTYKVVLRTTAQYHETNPFTLEVNGITEQTFTVTPVSIPAPADPAYCTVYCWAQELDGSIPAATFALTAKHSATASGKSVLLGADTATVNVTTGYAALTILRGAVVTLELSSATDRRRRERVVVPAADSVNWEDMGAHA